jgi:hypothetical protein
MKKMAIILIGILVALYLAAYRPWRQGGQGEKKSAGGLNVAQDSTRPATGAQDSNQPVKGVQRPVKEVEHRATSVQGAKRHGKGAKRSMTGGRQDVKQQDADLELQVIETRADYGANGCVPLRCEGRKLRVVETRDVERLTVDVMRPAVGADAVYVEVQAPSVEPTDVEYVEYSSDWAPAREIYLAAPERQECPTPYEVWVEFSDP